MKVNEHTRRMVALALLEEFTRRILPGAIRRIAAWKGIKRGQIPDLMDELRAVPYTDVEFLECCPPLPEAPPQLKARHARARLAWRAHMAKAHGLDVVRIPWPVSTSA